MTTLHVYVCTIVQCLHQPATILNPGGRAFAKRHSSTQAKGPILQASTSCHHITTSSKLSSYSAQPQETQLNHFKHSQVSPPPLSPTSPKIFVEHSNNWIWHLHCPIVHNDNDNKDTNLSFHHHQVLICLIPRCLLPPRWFRANKALYSRLTGATTVEPIIPDPHCLVLIIHPADWC